MRSFIVIAAAALLAGCGAGQPAASGTQPGQQEEPSQLSWTDVEVTLTVAGGMCPDGACMSAVTVDLGDGAWTRIDQSDAAEESGRLDSDAADALATEVEERWYALTAEPFEGTCPTAYDGTEVVLEYAAYPAGTDAELADADIRTTTTCQHRWPDGTLEELQPMWEATGAPWPVG